MYYFEDRLDCLSQKNRMMFSVVGSLEEVDATLSISTGLAGEAGAGQDAKH